jgi:hypothetical protein
MTGFFTRVLPAGMRIAFTAAGVMMLSPHQASELMLWINIAGALAGIALISYELKARRVYVRA